MEINKIFKKIAIVGLGVIGGSYAKALNKIGYEVYGVDTNKETLDKALNNEIVKKVSFTGEEFFKECDLIVMALYPNQIANFIKQNIKNFKEDVVLTDVAGLKSHFVDDIEKELNANMSFVFAHPMAGREKKGFDYSDEKVFKGANFIITPTRNTSSVAINKIKTLAKQMGFGTIKELSPKDHDSMIAYTSQLPHALAVALVNSDHENNKTGNFIGDSYRDLTRIANINEMLWSELFITNKDNLIEKIDYLECELHKIRECVEQENYEGLQIIFKEATKRRINLEK